MVFITARRATAGQQSIGFRRSLIQPRVQRVAVITHMAKIDSLVTKAGD